MSKIKLLLVIQGILSVCLAVLMFYVFDFDNAIFIISIPFEAIGKALRVLSLSSKLGNVIAFILYVLLSLLPLLYLLIKKLRVGLSKIDIVLPILSLFSFYLIYEFINPGLMLDRMPKVISSLDYLPMAKLSFSITFYALILGYLVLRILSNLTHQQVQDKRKYLCTQLSRILGVISTIYTFVLGYFFMFQLFSDLTVKSSEVRLPLSKYFVILSYLLTGLPIIFAILTLLAAIALLQAMKTDHMQEKELEAAITLGNISKRTVYITVLCNISWNLLQFLFTKMLNNTSYDLELSLTPLVIAVSAIILSGFFQETKELHEDNEMII